MLIFIAIPIDVHKGNLSPRNYDFFTLLFLVFSSRICTKSDINVRLVGGTICRMRLLPHCAYNINLYTTSLLIFCTMVNVNVVYGTVLRQRFYAAIRLKIFYMENVLPILKNIKRYEPAIFFKISTLGLTKKKYIPQKIITVE